MTHMGYPGPPPWPPQEWPPQQWPPQQGPTPVPPRNPTDVTISIIVMVLTVLVCGAGAFMGLFSLAFLDYCPPESCSVDGAVTSVMATVAIAALIGLAGVIVTIIRLTTRKRAWPFAVGTLATCIAVFFLGVFAYTAAIS